MMSPRAHEIDETEGMSLRFSYGDDICMFAWISNPYSAGIDFRRQNLTPKVDPRTVRVASSLIFIMAVDPYGMYSNKTESASEGIYDDFKLKKIVALHGSYTNIAAF